ncbi:hypothetical protein [Parvularcula sp. LCG005]|nr:hypothetical protein [Parvularcula sp. LCG005]WOI53803.1 hypothetical protein RUI03_02100 [Parvularcula sp. LCG005]
MASIHVIFSGAKDFPVEGRMIDDLHYNQEGYNVMGDMGAAAAALLVD